MIMHVQADTMMQNTGPGKVHTQFYFLIFFGFLIFWVHPANKQQRNSIYHQNIVYILCQKYSHPDVENRRAAAVPELTQTINQYIAMPKRCPVT